MKKKLLFVLLLIIGINQLFSQVQDPCDLPTNSIYLSNNDVWYNTDFNIKGFQFDIVDGVNADNPSGGDAEAAGFTVQGFGSIVLGFSFSGSSIPLGCGILTELVITGTPTALDNIVFTDDSNPSMQIEVSYYQESSDDGGEDCSSGYYDCNGICDGEGVEDCAGVCNGESIVDCAGVCDGNAVLDECDVCDGAGIPGNQCDCDGNIYDCAGICAGNSVLDCAGVCDGEAELDCASVCDGDAEIDDCGVCDGGINFTCADNTTECIPGDGTCDNECDYEGICDCFCSEFDVCGICGGDTSCLDCNDEVNGGLVVDGCGVCGGDGESCSQAEHLIFTRISVSPNNAEMIEIYNPTDSDIWLKRNDLEAGSMEGYYLTDATVPDEKYYYNFTDGMGNANFTSGTLYDFFISFPIGSKIGAGEKYIVGMHDNVTFNSYYGEEPDLSLFDNISNCYGCPGNGFGNDDVDDIDVLGNEEVLILFYWNGETVIVEDVDYFLWGGTTYGIDKTYVRNLDDAFIYFPDRLLNEQSFMGQTETHHSYFRILNEEIGEYAGGNGNGIQPGGDNETGENFEVTWRISQNPERLFGCTDDTICLNVEECGGYCANNYNPYAEVDDGSCEYIFGCMNSLASNYNIEATYDNGSCVIAWGCADLESANYDPEASNDYGSCIDEFDYQGIDKLIFDYYCDDYGCLSCYEDDNTNGICDAAETQVSIFGRIVSYSRIGATFWKITIVDDSGYAIDVVPGRETENEYWDIENSILSYLADPYNYTDYIISVNGVVSTYEESLQLKTVTESDVDDFLRFFSQGEFIDDINQKILSAEIIVAPYVLIPSIGERINFMYSFPNDSRVIVRIFSLDGRLITSLIDKFYDSSGTVLMARDNSSWDGKDHLGQVVSPGTYLIHIEAIDFKTGSSSVDVAPIVIGVPH